MKKKKWIWFWGGLFLIGFFSLFFIKAGFTINQVIGWENQNQASGGQNLPKLPDKDPDRINLLLLGIRGPEDPGEGKLLSDAIVILSIKKSTGQVALISLPRDLYVDIWGLNQKQRINFAYAYGGFETAKKTVALTSGLYIDHAVSLDFEALKEIIDTLGGISVYLEEPFEESFQWGKEGQEENQYWTIKEIDGEEKWVFHLPAGWNHLDGQTALYYVRSRYSTNDFDRMRRQQQVLLALKEKAFSLGVLANPIKTYNLLDLLGRHLRTDMNLADIKELVNLAGRLDTAHIRKRIFQAGPAGLLYDTFIDQEYVLLPVGDSFQQIQKVCQEIFNSSTDNQ